LIMPVAWINVRAWAGGITMRTRLRPSPVSRCLFI
jgi:hypothetical protein